VFSGKHEDGSPLAAGHRHAHFLCEAAGSDGRISHVTIFAPMGFDALDERAFTRLAQCGVWGRDGYELQLVLLGVGRAADFGGLNEKAGQSKLLATASVWESRTPFVLTRHLTRKGMPSAEAIATEPKLYAELIEVVRFELAQREQFKMFCGVNAVALDPGMKEKTPHPNPLPAEPGRGDKNMECVPHVVIEPLLDRQHAGTDLGGHFTSWLKFRRERLTGGGSQAGSSGFGFRLTFSKTVTGPIALGYGCHFGLGNLVAMR
jgi:CRISPR-associated protein Csb2